MELSNPSSVSAFNPPPPEVASFAGAHFNPSHFKTCPGLGGVLCVSTSDKSLISSTRFGLSVKLL